MLNAFSSLNQVEQADVIMAEYREGWAARAEKVRLRLSSDYHQTIHDVINCDPETIIRSRMTRSSRAGSSLTTSGSGRCCRVSRTETRRCFIGE